MNDMLVHRGALRIVILENVCIFVVVTPESRHFAEVFLTLTKKQRKMVRMKYY